MEQNLDIIIFPIFFFTAYFLFVCFFYCAYLFVSNLVLLTYSGFRNQETKDLYTSFKWTLDISVLKPFIFLIRKLRLREVKVPFKIIEFVSSTAQVCTKNWNEIQCFLHCILGKYWVRQQIIGAEERLQERNIQNEWKTNATIWIETWDMFWCFRI